MGKDSGTLSSFIEREEQMQRGEQKNHRKH